MRLQGREEVPGLTDMLDRLLRARQQRIPSAVGTDLLPHALAVLFTVAGVPSVYAAEAYAYTGVKEQRLGGDDAVRPGFRRTLRPSKRSKPSIAPRSRPCASTSSSGSRRRNPWLLRAHTDSVHLDNRQLVLRTGSGQGAVLVALNIATFPRPCPRPTHAPLPGRLTSGQIHLAAPGWAVLEN